MAYCGILYSMDINDIQQPLLSQQRVHSKAGTCPEVDLAPMLAYDTIVTHLKEMGYNTDQLNVEFRLRQYSVRTE